MNIWMIIKPHILGGFTMMGRGESMTVESLCGLEINGKVEVQ